MSQKTKQIQHDLRVKRNRPGKQLYTCSYCGYMSSRLYNVQRHEGRIHSKRPKVCCGQELLSKHQYYIHCEKHHPETRANATTSKYKYKISRYSVALDNEVKESCKPTLKRRFSERILTKKARRKTRSQVSLSYKVTYSDMEYSDIPLKYFLTDHRLRRRMKRLSSLSKMNKSDKTPKQDNEEMASENGVQRLDSFDLPEDNLIDLPAKKLILHRFRKSTTCRFGIPLRDENNNDPGHANTSEATAMATESVSLTQNYEYRSKNSKWGANKENLPTFAFSFQQKIDIVLDSCITAPVVTQLQRDFLDSFDFDQYRIF